MAPIRAEQMSKKMVSQPIIKYSVLSLLNRRGNLIQIMNNSHSNLFQMSKWKRKKKQHMLEILFQTSFGKLIPSAWGLNYVSFRIFSLLPLGLREKWAFTNNRCKMSGIIWVCRDPFMFYREDIHRYTGGRHLHILPFISYAALILTTPEKRNVHPWEGLTRNLPCGPQTHI